MTEEKPDAPAIEPRPKTGAPTWMKILLAVSLAMNLGIAGTVAGFAIRGGKDGDFGRPPVRETSFGPFSDALTRDQRRELLRGFMEKGPRGPELKEQIRQEYDGVITALKKEPFDASLLDQAVVQQGQKMIERLNVGRQALVDLVRSMSPEERKEFVQRLENAISHGKHLRN